MSDLNAKERYFTSALMGDAPHVVLPEAQAYIRDLQVQVADLQVTRAESACEYRAAVATLEARVADLEGALRGAMPWHPLIVDAALAPTEKEGT